MKLYEEREFRIFAKQGKCPHTEIITVRTPPKFWYTKCSVCNLIFDSDVIHEDKKVEEILI